MHTFDLTIPIANKDSHFCIFHLVDWSRGCSPVVSRRHNCQHFAYRHPTPRPLEMEQDLLLQKALSFADAMKIYKVCPIVAQGPTLLRSRARPSAIVDTNPESTPLLCRMTVLISWRRRYSSMINLSATGSGPSQLLFHFGACWCRLYHCSQLLDIHDSLFAWHQLDSLASFLQSDEIATMLSYYRGKLAEMSATSSVFLISLFNEKY